MASEEYLRGYEAAYAEIYAAIDSGDHPGICGGECRACGVMRSVIEDTLLNLGRILTEDEFATMANIMARASLRNQSR